MHSNSSVAAAVYLASVFRSCRARKLIQSSSPAFYTALETFGFLNPNFLDSDSSQQSLSLQEKLADESERLN